MSDDPTETVRIMADALADWLWDTATTDASETQAAMAVLKALTAEGRAVVRADLPHGTTLAHECECGNDEQTEECRMLDHAAAYYAREVSS